MVQSESAEQVESNEDDKFATIKPNEGSTPASMLEHQQGADQQSSSQAAENLGVNLYILAGHEDMRMQL